MKTNIRIFLSLLALYCLSAAAQSPAKPNIVLILADDLGYADVGFNGSTEIPTPNIDRIAKNGAVFTNGYVSYAVCGPSRAGLITGRYQNRFGYTRNPLFAPDDPNVGLPLTEKTLADELKTAGYTNGIIGKWHLGAHESLKPKNRGFDQFYGFLTGGHDYFPENLVLNDLTDVQNDWAWYRTKLLRNDARVEETEYLTDAFSREAVSFIQNNGTNPFFLYLAYNAPHTPLQATEKYLERFAHIQDAKRRTYSAMVSALDDGVGRVLDALEQQGILENTIVIFLSDNGGPEHDNASDNGPLREGKGSFHEGGVRVPFAMQWPSQIPAGITYHEPVISLDIFVVACAAAGVQPQNELDGVNIVPFITGEKTGSPHEALFWTNPDRNHYAIRQGAHKLVNEKPVRNQVFDLTADVSEKAPLTVPDIQKTLLTAYQAWEASLAEPLFHGLGQKAAYNKLKESERQLADYTLIWADEFNEGTTPDPAKWQYEKGFVRNNELQWYSDQNATIENGKLVIEGRREQLPNPNYKRKSDNWKESRKYAEYTAASIKTRDLFSFQYGIIEVRAKIDTAMGMWPAIWLLGNTQPWPACGEIDMLEFYRIKGQPTILANTAHSLSASDPKKSRWPT